MSAIFESLKGKKVLITGSSRGIGRALAIGFAQNGCDVALHGVSHGKSMDEAIELVSKYDTKVISVCGDLSDTDVPARLIAETIEGLGGIDILVCNASLQIKSNWLDITDEDMLSQTKTNLFSTIKLMQASVPHMLNSGWGRLITIGSTQQEKPLPDLLVYSALKSAVRNVVISLARQLAEKNITVNNVSVGTIHTDRTAGALQNEAIFQREMGNIPVKFIGEPEDCVAGVLWLASHEGRYTTGDNIHIDGGKFM